MRHAPDAGPLPCSAGRPRGIHDDRAVVAGIEPTSCGSRLAASSGRGILSQRQTSLVSAG